MSKYASITTNKYIDKNKSETIEKRLTPAPIGNKYFQKVINPVIEKSNSLTIKKSDLYELIKQFILKFADSGSKDYAKLSEGLVPLLKNVDNIPELNDLISLARNAGIPRGSDALSYIGDAWRAAKAAIPEAITPATIPDITAPTIPDITAPTTRTASESLSPETNTTIPFVPKYRNGTVWHTKYVADINKRINDIVKSNTQLNDNELIALKNSIENIQYNETALHRLYGDNISWPKIVIPQFLHNKIYNNKESNLSNLSITSTNDEYNKIYQTEVLPEINKANQDIRRNARLNDISVQDQEEALYNPIPKNTSKTSESDDWIANADAKLNASLIESNNARNREQLAASPYEIPDQDLIRINQKINAYESRVSYINTWMNNLQKSGNKPNSGFYAVIRELLTQASDIQKESRKIAKPINLPQLIIPETLYEKIYQQGILTLKNKKMASIVPDVQYNDTYSAATKTRTASESTTPSSSNRTIYSTADDANTRGIIMNPSTTVPMPTTWYTSGNDRERFQKAIIQYKNEVADLNKRINNLTKLGRNPEPVTYILLRQNIKFIQELKAQLDVAFDTYGKAEVLPRIVIPKSLEYKIYESTSTPNAKGEIPSRLNKDFAVIPTDDKYERDYMLRAFPDIKQRYGNKAALNYDETVLYERKRELEREEKEKAGGIIDYQKLTQEQNARKAAEKAILDAAEKRRITDGRVLSTPEYLAYVQAQRANAPENIRALGTRTGKYGEDVVNSKWQHVDGIGRIQDLHPGQIDQLLETGNLGSNAGWTVTPSDKTRAYSAATARVATPSGIAETKDERHDGILSRYQEKYKNNLLQNYQYMFQNPKSYDEFLNPPNYDEYYNSFLNDNGLLNPVSAIPGSDPRFKTFGATPRKYYQTYQFFADKVNEAVKNNDDKKASELIAQWESDMREYYKKESLADQQDPAQIARVKAFDAIENPTDQDVQEYWLNSPGEKIYPHVPNSMQLENNTAWPSLQSVYDRHAAENAEIEGLDANEIAFINGNASRVKRRSANESSPPIIGDTAATDKFIDALLEQINSPRLDSVTAAFPKVLASNKRVASETAIPDAGVDDADEVYEDYGDISMALEGKSPEERLNIANQLVDMRTADYSDDEIKMLERTYGKNWHSRIGGINSHIEAGQQPGLFVTRRNSSGTKTPTYRNETFSVDPSTQRDSLTQIDPFSEKTVYPSDRFLKKRNKK